MADTRMSRTEREQFLADLHVGVLSIPNGDGPPLTAPVWYDYEPGGDYWVLTGRDSQKGKLLQEGSQVTLVAQQETLPYAYVSVEGTVTGIRDCDKDQDTRPMARRYLGEDMGNAYTEANEGDSVHVRVRPNRWLTVDYGKS
ncbi:MAG: pyridoxamine 5'-phosphate oxidase family protein [Pseudomonadales bacterium]